MKGHLPANSMSYVLLAAKGSHREEGLRYIRQLTELILLLNVSLSGKYHQRVKVLRDIRRHTLEKEHFRCLLVENSPYKVLIL
jgi:hypothetical protein